MSKTVVEVIEEMRAYGAAVKAESFADDTNQAIVAVVYADGREAAEELLAAFKVMEERRLESVVLPDPAHTEESGRKGQR